MGNEDKNDGMQTNQRSSGEQEALREKTQQRADQKSGLANRRQTHKGERDQDDGGDSGISGRDRNSR